MASFRGFPLPEIMSLSRGLGITNYELVRKSAGYNEVSRRISCSAPVAEGYPLLDESRSLAGSNTITEVSCSVKVCED
jgi:hypothetical protein